jgi:hypothetical protein
VKLALENADTETVLTQLLADLRDLFDGGGCPPCTWPAFKTPLNSSFSGRKVSASSISRVGEACSIVR